jgi:hypothetical protein
MLRDGRCADCVERNSIGRTAKRGFRQLILFCPSRYPRRNQSLGLRRPARPDDLSNALHPRGTARSKRSTLTESGALRWVFWTMRREPRRRSTLRACGWCFLNSIRVCCSADWHQVLTLNGMRDGTKPMPSGHMKPPSTSSSHYSSTGWNAARSMTKRSSLDCCWGTLRMFGARMRPERSIALPIIIPFHFLNRVADQRSWVARFAVYTPTVERFTLRTALC